MIQHLIQHCGQCSIAYPAERSL
ncbi:hypothetical protein HaLaN_29853, partial [Haematococcus lacustris]